MRPQVAAVVAAAGVVARNQFTKITKKVAVFSDFFVQTDSFMQVLGTDTYFGEIPTPKSG